MSTNYFCFDVGNVLCDVDFTNFLNELEVARGISHEESWFFLNRIQPLQDLGHMTMKNELRHTYGLKLEEHPKVLEAWNSSVTPNPISIKHFEEMCSYPNEAAILSNIGTEHFELIGQRLGDKYGWCKRHMSCEVGLRKPSRMYYKTFLAEHPQFEGAHYIDDRHENLDMGSECGLIMHHIDTTKVTPEELDRFWYNLKNEVIYRR